MESLGKIYPHHVIDVANCTIARFICSDKLLSIEDVKLERLKLAILFTIDDIFWVRKTRQMHVTSIRGCNKLGTEISLTLHSPLFFH